MGTDTEKTKDVEITEDVSFQDMMLSAHVLSGLTKCNFIKPSPIQLRAIPIGRCGLDLIIQSKSGTGKTLVFCTIILEKYDSAVKAPQSLIVVPTREIALQVETYLNTVGASCPGFSVTCVIGGRDIVDDRKRISKCKAIVGTPGRLLHLIKNKCICLQNIEILVLDEADKLVTDDFYNDIHILLDALNTNRQIIASSATYANDLDKQIVAFMHNPIAVSTSRDTPVLIGVKQFILPVENFTVPKSVENSNATIQAMWRKVAAVEYVLSTTAFKQCILFSNSQFRANSFANYLTQNKWTVDLVLGSHDQSTRTATLQKFRQYKSRILVTSDLMARGVDIVNVNLVINLDVPGDSSTYLHRIGRCGRFGRRGLAITLASDGVEMEKFQKLLGIIGGKNMKVDSYPVTLKGDTKFDAWNATDCADSLEPIVFGTDQENNSIDSPIKPILNGSSDAQINESQAESIEMKNLNLLEVAKLLVDTGPNKQQPIVNVDEDLFANFESSQISNDIHPQPVISSDIFEEFAQSNCNSNDQAVQEQKHLPLVKQRKDGENSTLNESVSTEVDKEPNQQKTSANSNEKKNASKKSKPQEKSTKSKSEKLQKAKGSSIQYSVQNERWTQIYWQQLSDINQYISNSHDRFK